MCIRWNESINSETLSSTAPFVINGYTYKSFGSSAKYDYAVFVQGTDEYAQKYAQLLSVSFASIKQYYDEKYDRSNFIKNVILDNILPGDIYLKARELHFNSEVSRVCLLIKIVSKTDVSAYDIVQNIFPDKTKDFVININEEEIALVKEVKADTESRDLEKLASSIADTLSSEFYTHCVVGIGTTVTMITSASPVLSISCPQLSAKCSSMRYSSAAASRASTRRPSLPSSASSKTTSTFRRPPESCLYTATPLCTDLRRSRSSPVLTCVSSRTLLYSR